MLFFYGEILETSDQKQETSSESFDSTNDRQKNCVLVAEFEIGSHVSISPAIDKSSDYALITKSHRKMEKNTSYSKYALSVDGMGKKESYGVISFVKVKREANYCAHNLARRAYQRKESEIWLMCIPSWLFQLANEDLL